MFSYFGSKSKLVHKYKPPNYDRIVEPFCGSARYACLHYGRDVWINDKYEVIYCIWKWIQQATCKDIDSLPELWVGESLDDYTQLSIVERDLMGFMVGLGVGTPNNICTMRACGDRKGNDGQRTHYVKSFKRNIKRLIGRIDHWKITNLDYSQMGNVKATWFIDPPYQQAGDSYPQTITEYGPLLRWIKSRRGETITCENSTNDWLDYSKPLSSMGGSRHTTQEVVRYG